LKIKTRSFYVCNFSDVKKPRNSDGRNKTEQTGSGRNSLSFIADNKGHLLPGVEKSSQNPFGDYVGTWDLPKSIPGPYHLVKVAFIST
jgi:hypothetical protein